MKIFKENSYDIVRLYINQLGIMIFSMMLYTAVGSIENEKLSNGLSIFVSIFSICFYLALVYYATWELGAKDKIRIDGGRVEPCNNKGLIMSLYANLPNFVLGFCSTVLIAVYKLAESDGLKSAFALVNLFTRLNASMYMGFITGIVPSNSVTDGIDSTKFLIESILFTVLPLISVAVIHFAYRLGLKEKKLLSVFGNKK